MRHSYQLPYRRIFLRPLEQQDIEALRILRNKNRRYFHTSKYITPEQQRKWFAQYLTKENDIMFVIELLSDPGKFMGAIALYNINKKAKTAEFGRVLVDKTAVLGKGIGTEAVIAVCRIAFESLGLEKVTAEVLKNNHPASKTYANAGCTVIGENAKNYILEITPGTIRSKE